MVVKAYSLESRNGGILSKVGSSYLQEGFSQFRENSVGFQVSVEVNMEGFHDGRMPKEILPIRRSFEENPAILLDFHPCVKLLGQ
jgi:hypothetical protein